MLRILPSSISSLFWQIVFPSFLLIQDLIYVWFMLQIYNSIPKTYFPVFNDKAIIWVNTLRLRQNDDHFANDIYKCIFLKEWIPINISLTFIPTCSIQIGAGQGTSHYLNQWWLVYGQIDASIKQDCLEPSVCQRCVFLRCKKRILKMCYDYH